jgi:hypothetical protein
MRPNDHLRPDVPAEVEKARRRLITGRDLSKTELQAEQLVFNVLWDRSKVLYFRHLQRLPQGVFSFQIFMKNLCRLIFKNKGVVSRETC